MLKISRSDFLKQSLQAGSLVFLSQFPVSSITAASPNDDHNISPIDEDIMKRLVSTNDKYVARLVQSNQQSMGRRLGHDIALLASAYAVKDSTYYHSDPIVQQLESLVKRLLSYQSADGTLNFGNLESPPDTGFLLESLTAGAFILAKDNSAALTPVNNELKKFITKAADALAIGGVHTPNHRWVICAALARVNAIYPDKKYTNRIQDWLGEGIFIDKDGHYPERSQNYAVVEDNSLITMSRLLNMPQLLEPVRRNLDMTYYYMEPNGDLVVADSRRQDQWSGKRMISFYLHYRYMAVKDNSGKFAGITKLIETMDGFENEVLNTSLYQFLENPLLQQQVPAPVQPPVQYEKLFTTSSLLRIRRDDMTTTLFGGIDWPIVIASGRSNSPDFYSFRKGRAVLKYMRISTSFFSTGYFYSEGLVKEGNRYKLHKKLDVPYYQPLPKNRRRADGDYKLSPSIDDRFWNKMDFQNRPVSNVKSQETTVYLEQVEGGNDVTIQVAGPAGVAVTLELCFKEGGKLTGTVPAPNENAFLEKGTGTYEFEGDSISFGPGIVVGRSITGLEGERYSTHFGSLRTEGMHVYLTGVTPFNHKLSFR